MRFETSWDDGNELDFQLAELLLTYKIPATFYIPSTCELLPKDIAKLSNMGFQIGAHTTSHPERIWKLPEDEQRSEMSVNKEWLQEIIGKEVTSFCYPSGRYNDRTVEIVKELGFKDARTTKVLCTDNPINPFLTITSVHAMQGRKEYNGMNWYDMATTLFDFAKSKDGYFHLFGHSWEIDISEEWGLLEKFLKYARQNS